MFLRWCAHHRGNYILGITTIACEELERAPLASDWLTAAACQPLAVARAGRLALDFPLAGGGSCSPPRDAFAVRLAPGGGSLGSGLSPRGAIPAGGLAGPRPPQANEKGPPQVSERGVGGTLPPPATG